MFAKVNQEKLIENYSEITFVDPKKVNTGKIILQDFRKPDLIIELKEYSLFIQ